MSSGKCVSAVVQSVRYCIGHTCLLIHCRAKFLSPKTSEDQVAGNDGARTAGSFADNTCGGAYSLIFRQRTYHWHFWEVFAWTFKTTYIIVILWFILAVCTSSKFCFRRRYLPSIRCFCSLLYTLPPSIVGGWLVSQSSSIITSTHKFVISIIVVAFHKTSSIYIPRLPSEFLPVFCLSTAISMGANILELKC